MIASRRATGSPLCGPCWAAVRPPKTCSSCGRPARRPRRDDAGGVLCTRCYEARKPREVCGVCGVLKRVHHHRADGAALCSNCNTKARPPEPCRRCGRTARVVARRADGPRCEACWVYERTGRRCGCAAPFLVDRVCILCAADRQGRAELAHAVRDLLVAGGGPARQRLRATVTGRLLQEMLRGELPVDHRAVDGLDRPRPAAVLRARLVADGVLEHRDAPLAEVQHTLNEAVSRAHPADARTLASFGRWVVLHGVAVRIDRGKARIGTPKAARAKIRRIARLLADLRREHIALSDLEQRWVDDWIAARRSARPDLRVFLGWARRQGLVTDPVDVDPATSSDVRTEIEETERRTLLTRVLDDDTIESRDRVAGFLLVGLGQPLTRIVALTTDHVTGDEATRLLLGTSPLRMPPPIDGLLRALAAAAAQENRRWLFAGSRTHLSPERLSERLANLGITNIVAARNAAWASLAAETPPVILAEKLGASASTADKWSNAVGSDRNLYAALKAAAPAGMSSPTANPVGSALRWH